MSDRRRTRSPARVSRCTPALQVPATRAAVQKHGIMDIDMALPKTPMRSSKDGNLERFGLLSPVTPGFAIATYDGQINSSTDLSATPHTPQRSRITDTDGLESPKASRPSILPECATSEGSVELGDDLIFDDDNDEASKHNRVLSSLFSKYQESIASLRSSQELAVERLSGASACEDEISPASKLERCASADHSTTSMLNNSNEDRLSASAALGVAPDRMDGPGDIALLEEGQVAAVLEVTANPEVAECLSTCRSSDPSDKPLQEAVQVNLIIQSPKSRLDTGSPTWVRRSTRIIHKEVSEVPATPTSAPRRKTKNTIEEPVPVPSPAPTIRQYAIDDTPADTIVLPPSSGIPTPLSLCWQLQYPPGGSTHASYPYPSPDPLLTFRPSIVPLIDGVPNTLAHPKLLLPIGWKHISWSGLLPIVFDPYQQGFKLTPVGPMPLTAEELQQGGLARYVPGGHLHPEAGLLPDMMQFGDGSDTEIWNFDGIDWVLPFSEVSEEDRTENSDTSKAAETLKLEPVHSTPGAMQCPDNIVDLEDGWRWLSEREKNPASTFVPSPGKTWKGTGIHRTSRKFKAPIASLMAVVLKEEEDPLLCNQNGREFCAFRSVATTVHADIRLMKDVEITLVELIAYFPNHYLWRKAADRIVHSGMSAADLANMINMQRKLSGEAVRNKDTIYSTLHYERDENGSSRRTKIVRGEHDATTSYTSEGWDTSIWDKIDYPLLGITHGLEKLPDGPDAGPLTALILWCRAQGHYNAMLSQVPKLLEEAGIEPLIEPGKFGCPDKEVLARYADKLKLDRKRVLADRKRPNEETHQSKVKRRKKE